MTPQQEIIDRFNRLHTIGTTKPLGLAKGFVTVAMAGVWRLRRETRSREVLIVAYNTATDKQPLYGRWRPERSLYDYRYDTYIADECENVLLPALRAAFILDDLSRL